MYAVALLSEVGRACVRSNVWLDFLQLNCPSQQHAQIASRHTGIIVFVVSGFNFDYSGSNTEIKLIENLPYLSRCVDREST